MNKEKISIRLDLEGEFLEQFNFLRKELGIFTGTDLIRYLIVKKYKELKEKQQ